MRMRTPFILSVPFVVACTNNEPQHVEFFNVPAVAAVRNQEHSHLDHPPARIIERLANAEVEPTRSQVIQAIRDYETDVLRQVTYQGP